VVGAAGDTAEETLSALSLYEGAEFAAFEFGDDGAQYRETLSCTRGVTHVRHRLSFTLFGNPADISRAVSQLAALAAEGVVAIVQTNSGEAIAAGYSKRLGVERALRLSQTTLSTGRTVADEASATVVLESEDHAASMTYTGSIQF
jgi:hypothetical protein